MSLLDEPFNAVEFSFGANGTGPTSDTTGVVEEIVGTLVTFVKSILRAGRGSECRKEGGIAVDPNLALKPDDIL